HVWHRRIRGPGGPGATNCAAPPRSHSDVNLLRHAAEELVHHHLRDATDQALRDTRDHAADLAVAGHLDDRLAVLVLERDQRLALAEARAATSLDRHLVALGLDGVADPDLALVGALHRRDADLDRGLVCLGPDERHRLAARNARFQRFGIEQERENLLAR